MSGIHVDIPKNKPHFPTHPPFPSFSNLKPHSRFFQLPLIFPSPFPPYTIKLCPQIKQSHNFTSINQQSHLFNLVNSKSSKLEAQNAAIHHGDKRRQSHRHRSRNDIQLRGRMAKRPRRDHPQRPRQPHHPILRGIHWHRTPHRRRRQKPSRHEPPKHRLRRQTPHRPSFHRPLRPKRHETLAFQVSFYYLILILLIVQFQFHSSNL